MDEEIKNADENIPSEEENKTGISADLIRGHINTIILRTLYERDKYGYEIIEEIEAKSHGQYSLKQPTLYSALKRLESQGYINAYWKTDEVSQGGRRKYYTLTDSGREVAEKNQAEWEYSRTVIDNLISDRSFDFTQPPPTAVDFKILKNSTSRVPVLKDTATDGEATETEREVKIDDTANAINPSLYVAENKAEEQIKADEDKVQTQHFTVAPKTEETVNEVYSKAVMDDGIKNPVYESHSENVEESQRINYNTSAQMSEEQRRIVHENYLKLISQPAKEPQETPPAPYAENIDTEKLIYNNKPETERDYRNLINNLFVKTVNPKPEAKPAKRDVSQVYVRYEDAAVKAEGDGLKVNTAEYEIGGQRRKKFNMGKTLFKCSVIIGIIMLLEFALCIIFRKELHVSLGYPFCIFAIACAQIAIFGALYTTNVGKNSRKPATLTYFTASIVITVLLILIIIVTSILINVNFASTGDIMAKIVVPCIVALNIPAFATCFYFFSK